MRFEQGADANFNPLSPLNLGDETQSYYRLASSSRTRVATHSVGLQPSQQLIKMTGFRLLLTFSFLGAGLCKAILAYLGFSAAPTTLDWIVGIVLALTSVVLRSYRDKYSLASIIALVA